MGAVVEFVELAVCEIFRRVPMGGRFGKYGDAKRKARVSGRGSVNFGDAL